MKKASIQRKKNVPFLEEIQNKYSWVRILSHIMSLKLFQMQRHHNILIKHSRIQLMLSVTKITVLQLLK